MNQKQRFAVAAGGIVALVAVSFLYLGYGTGETAGMDAGNAELVALGKPLYDANCASCHGLNLEGQANWRVPLPAGGLPAPPHDETGHTWHHPDKLLFDYTKFGGARIAPPDFKSNMPGFEETLSDKEIWAVLSYIESRWPDDVRKRQSYINRQASNN